MKCLPEEKEKPSVAAKTDEFVSAMVDWLISKFKSGNWYIKEHIWYRMVSQGSFAKKENTVLACVFFSHKLLFQV